MKRVLAILLLCLLAAASAEAQTSSLGIDYNGAALTRIEVNDDVLKYVWYTPKHVLLMRQNLDSYDKHVFQTRLTPAQTVWLDTWAVRDHVFALRRLYPSTRPGSYGTAFRFTLTVRRGSVSHVSDWDDTSHAKPAWTAAQELRAWCERQRDGRPLSPR